MAIKVVMIWESSSMGGWTETYHKDGVLAADLSHRWGNAFLTPRLALASPAAFVRAIRYSDTRPGVRKSDLQQLGEAWSGQASNNKAGVDSGPAPRGAAALISMAGARGRTRNLWLRGCLDYDLEGWRVNTPQFSETARANLARWIETLVGGGYGILAKVPPRRGVDGVLNTDWHKCLAFTEPAPGRLLLSIGAHTIPVGGVVNVTGFDAVKLPGLKGLFRVVATTGESVTVMYSQAGPIAGDTRLGKVRQSVEEEVDIFLPSRCQFIRTTHHDTRRPFGRSRAGRRATRLRY